VSHYRRKAADGRLTERSRAAWERGLLPGPLVAIGADAATLLLDGLMSEMSGQRLYST